MMNLQDITQNTKEFLRRYIGEREIGLDEEIFSSGLVNSLFAIQLVLFLEKEFQIKVENKDLDLKNFRTINAIGEFVLHKKAGV